MIAPAIVFLLLSKLGATPRLPRPIQAFFRWVGQVGNITLAIYCTAVALWALTAFRQPDLELHEGALLGVLIVAMLALAVSFWRSARRSGR